MEKKGQKAAKPTSIKKILITQPRPESEKSPYFEIEKKYGVSITFQPFIKIEGVTAKDFRKQKIDIPLFSSVIFSSRHAIDHFFRLAEEMRLNVSQDTKYFCISESVALYLQKFILYRKRKVFFGADGTSKSLYEILAKHKSNENFLFPCSDHSENEVVAWLVRNECKFELPIMYKTVSSDVKGLLVQENFDVICFFTPSGVKSLFENIPGYKQKSTIIGAFGLNTVKFGVDSGLSITIKAPEPQAPGMATALDRYLAEHKKQKKS
jgi:uroporphyrinogen-III synthase